jgi:hypothetical protein
MQIIVSNEEKVKNINPYRVSVDTVEDPISFIKAQCNLGSASRLI